MLRAPDKWAHEATTKIPFEMVVTPSGQLAIGYARGFREARGLQIDPSTGQPGKSWRSKKQRKKLSRVVPVVGNDGAVEYVTTLQRQNGVRDGVMVSSTRPFVVGFSKTHCVALPKSGGEPRKLWPLSTKQRPNALRTLAVDGRGVAVAYRTGRKQIWFGWLNAEGGVVHGAKAIPTKAIRLGTPMLGHNGRDWSLVFAEEVPLKSDKATGAKKEGTKKKIGKGPRRPRLRAKKKKPLTRKVVRWARAPIGELLGDPQLVALPPGGPGGNAIAPAVAGLSGQRWLFMWTEGKPGTRVIRAQTYGADYQLLGRALRVSPATGSFGQGTVGVEGERAAVVFLMQAARRRYEIWGTVLQCR